MEVIHPKIFLPPLETIYIHEIIKSTLTDTNVIWVGSTFLGFLWVVVWLDDSKLALVHFGLVALKHKYV